MNVSLIPEFRDKEERNNRVTYSSAVPSSSSSLWDTTFGLMKPARFVPERSSLVSRGRLATSLCKFVSGSVYFTTAS